VTRSGAVTRALLKASAFSLIVAAGVAIIGVLTGDFDETTARVAATTLAIALYNATGSAGVAAATGPTRALGMATVVASAVTMVLAVAAIWSGDDEGVEPWGMTTAVTLALAQAAVYLSRAWPTDSRGVRLALLVIVCTGTLLAALIVAAIAEDFDGEAVWRVLGVFAVLNGLGMGLVPILRRLAPAPAAVMAGAPRVIELAPGALARELDARVAAGASLALAPVELEGGGRLAAVREGRAVSVLVEAE
jgi:hypothetical protein